jgi:hypothetical protein
MRSRVHDMHRVRTSRTHLKRVCVRARLHAQPIACGPEQPMIATSRPMPHVLGRDSQRSARKDNERPSRAAGGARVGPQVTS